MHWFGIDRRKQGTKQERRKRMRTGLDRRHYLGDLIHTRMLFGIFLVLFGFVMMGVRLVWVGFQPPTDVRLAAHAGVQDEQVRRGDILDRHGIVLATTLTVYSLYADPKMMLDTEEATLKLAKLFPDLSVDVLRKKFENRERRFVWLKRHLTPVQSRAVNALGLPGLAFQEEQIRVYPHGNILAHVLGGVDVDAHGLAGIEAAYDGALNRGEDITLTIDTRIQSMLHKTLEENLQRTRAAASWGVVLEAGTGDILASVSLPDYDPNHYREAAKESWQNRITSGVYEMGSTFKLFTVAQALDLGNATTETKFDCTAPIHIGRYTVKDFHPHYEWMTMREIFARSSNIGAAKIALTFPEGVQKVFYDRLHLLEALDPGLTGVARPLYPKTKWGQVHYISMSYGHGIAVTSLQMAAAVAALSTDGIYRAPILVKGSKREKPYRVIKESTVAGVRDLMREVVINGTGRSAQVVGYDIGGKTGTSEKNLGGHYEKNKNVASFTGVMPLNDPKLVTLIMVDEPKEPYATGGMASAPAYGVFLKRVAPVLALKPDPTEFTSAAAAAQKGASSVEDIIKQAAGNESLGTSGTQDDIVPGDDH